MIKAGIFDAGGVLIKWDGKHINDDVKATLHLSDEVFSREWAPRLHGLDTGVVTEEAFWDSFRKATGSTHLLPKESLFLRSFREKFSPNTEVLGLVKQLREQNVPLAILSNTIQTHVDFLAEQGIYEHFSTVIFSHEVGYAKPSPEIYQLTLEKLSLLAEQTFFVDDRQENVDAANQIGMHGILFHTAKQLEEELTLLKVLV